MYSGALKCCFSHTLYLLEPQDLQMHNSKVLWSAQIISLRPDCTDIEKQPRTHAFPDKHWELQQSGESFFHIKHTLPCHLLINQQLYRSIQHKQAVGSSESYRPASFLRKEPSLRACRGRGTHHPVTESSTSAKRQKQRAAFRWEKVEKVNKETLWNRFPSCTASLVNKNRIQSASEPLNYSGDLVM